MNLFRILPLGLQSSKNPLFQPTSVKTPSKSQELRRGGQQRVVSLPTTCEDRGREERKELDNDRKTGSGTLASVIS